MQKFTARGLLTRSSSQALSKDGSECGTHETSSQAYMISKQFILETNKTNSVASSPQANYTDQATAACR
jgi:hypothetical protein